MTEEKGNIPQPIHAITFAPFARKGMLDTEAARQSLLELKKRTHANAIILVPGGLQDTPQSESIVYASEGLTDDTELRNLITFAHEQDLKVFLKPTVNCKNGTWRAHISFFDEDVPCEPKWGNWFAAYTGFQCHYAALAEESGCEMFIAGCEMVMSEHREKEWRDVIRAIRGHYHGPVSYNTDKYQEHNVNWWDEVDIISSSGYYPIYDWEAQLDRIERVVKKFDKPFFFAETGCMSVKGSEQKPNDWSVRGPLDLGIQADWYETMFSAIRRRPWVSGTALWSWTARLDESVPQSLDYEIYGKPAEQIVAKYYAS